MTFLDLVNEVCDRLNYTSDDTRLRVGQMINRRYRRLTSQLGLITSRRINLNLSVDPSGPDSILPDLIVEGVEKVVRVTTTDTNDNVRVLRELSYDTLTARKAIAGQVTRNWAVNTIGNDSVTITLDSYPSTTFTLHIEGIITVEDMEDDDIPVFPESFHDILVWGALADEHLKLEKPQLATIDEQNYAQRTSDLKMFITSSAYRDLAQGLDRPSQMWCRGFQRTGFWW